MRYSTSSRRPGEPKSVTVSMEPDGTSFWIIENNIGQLMGSYKSLLIKLKAVTT